MNPFDAVVCAVAIVVIVMGFNSGLLRSLATILGYLIAAPLAIAVTPRVTALVLGGAASPEHALLILCIAFVAAGIVVSALLRIGVGELVGPDVGLFDRLAGAALGAVRIVLVAVLIVAIFDRVIPPDRQPQFLAGSRLRPYLSWAEQKGLEALPPNVADYIDRWKREHGI